MVEGGLRFRVTFKVMPSSGFERLFPVICNELVEFNNEFWFV